MRHLLMILLALPAVSHAQWRSSIQQGQYRLIDGQAMRVDEFDKGWLSGKVLLNNQDSMSSSAVESTEQLQYLDSPEYLVRTVEGKRGAPGSVTVERVTRRLVHKGDPPEKALAIQVASHNGKDEVIQMKSIDPSHDQIVKAQDAIKIMQEAAKSPGTKLDVPRTTWAQMIDDGTPSNSFPYNQKYPGSRNNMIKMIQIMQSVKNWATGPFATDATPMIFERTMGADPEIAVLVDKPLKEARKAMEAAGSVRSREIARETLRSTAAK
jgi:hypothetical protein